MTEAEPAPEPGRPSRARHYACIHPETYKYFFAKPEVREIWQRLAAAYGEVRTEGGFGVMEIQSERFIFRATLGGNPVTVIRTRRCTPADVEALHRQIGFRETETTTMTTTNPTFQLDSMPVFLHDGGQATSLVGGPEFWATLGQRRDLDHGWLVTRATMTTDWDHWEMHPEGEELVTLISGHVTLVLDAAGQAEVRLELRAGQTTINPRGVWHRAILHEPSDMLFMTAGRGTQTRPV